VYAENGSYRAFKKCSDRIYVAFKFVRQAFNNKLRLFVSAQNLFTITKYTGLDP
jgi:hypothetical protein